MKVLIIIAFILSSTIVTAKNSLIKNKIPKHKEYHVSVKGNDHNDGSLIRPLRTIMAAANLAMPGDIITVHAGIYRERIAPPRSGLSDTERITYQAAEGENVVITGSEAAKGWKKVKNDTWKIILPNSFFGATNPFDEQIYGSWYHGNGKPNHTGSVYLKNNRLRETFSLDDVVQPSSKQALWYAEADGNGGPIIMNLEWICPAGAKKVTSAQGSVENGDQALWMPGNGRWPFAYLKNGSVLHYDNVDFGSGTDSLTFQAATFAKTGFIEMHLNDPKGELLGSAQISSTGDWEKFAVFTLKMHRKLSGRENICLVIKGPALSTKGQTTIWAQFPQETNPNNAPVEISVRAQVFYPDKTGINYITVRGFTLENAATNWASPSAEQPGLIGPRWAKGWVIENNIIRNSRCSGLSLGRPTFGHSHHYQNLSYRVYPELNGGQTEQQLISFFANGTWTKEEAGFHVIRNNHIYDCGQAGIVGCSGGAFSTIDGNEIHDICVAESFTGQEMAGIKLHFAIDAILKNNHIYNTIRGLWLDWGTQGTQVIGNVFHDNGGNQDVFIEVSHGPVLFANNILLSQRGISLSSQGIAVVHNLISGTISGGKDSRYSFLYQPHQTQSVGKSPNLGGDWMLYNNVISGAASVGKWNDPKLPVQYSGNVFTKGAKNFVNDTTASIYPDFDPDIKILKKPDGWYLSFKESMIWKKERKRKIITTQLLSKTIISNQSFTNPDDSPLIIDYDFWGNKRDTENPFPGPFELTSEGTKEIKIWPKSNGMQHQ